MLIENKDTNHLLVVQLYTSQLYCVQMRIKYKLYKANMCM